jgi:hypothetical protein
MKIDTTLRVARPTDRLEEVVRFYTIGLGLNVLGSFENHEGFDGVMVGVPGARIISSSRESSGTSLAVRPRPTTCSCSTCLTRSNGALPSAG